MLKNAGFKDVEIFFKFINFSGFIGIKWFIDYLDSFKFINLLTYIKFSPKNIFPINFLFHLGVKNQIIFGYF